MKKRFVVGATFAAVLGVAAFAEGCSSEDAPRLSRKGELCQTGRDCEADLACVPQGASGVSLVGVCVTGEFRVQKTAKECVARECEQAIDCCPPPSGACAQLQALCADSGAGPDGGATSSACRQYELSCGCDALKFDCADGACKARCNLDSDCSSGSERRCSGGACVECVTDAHCGGGEACVSGRCQEPCKNDGDCPGFQRCSAGACVDGKCASDRECVALTRNVEATCATDGKCVTPCASDIECGSPTGYRFMSCLEGQCTYTGCEGDKECQLSLVGGDAGLTSAGRAVHFVCRDRSLAN